MVLKPTTKTPTCLAIQYWIRLSVMVECVDTQQSYDIRRTHIKVYKQWVCILLDSPMVTGGRNLIKRITN